MAEDQKDRILTVGDLREALKWAKDDEMIIIQPGHGLPQDPLVLTRVFTGQYMIPWEHDCTDSDDPDHHAGIACPKVIGVELEAQRYEELELDET